VFFYLYCDRGFNCLYGGQTKRCLISWSLCDNPENNLGQHKRLWNGRLSRRWEWLLVMGNISPRRCRNPLRFLVFHFETAHEPVSQIKHRHFAFSTKLWHS